MEEQRNRKIYTYNKTYIATFLSTCNNFFICLNPTCTAHSNNWSVTHICTNIKIKKGNMEIQKKLTFVLCVLMYANLCTDESMKCTLKMFSYLRFSLSNKRN